MKKISLLIINPNNDFVDPRGSMYIKNSDIVMMNLAKWINFNHSKITTIFCCMECHTIRHISFPDYWKTGPKGTIKPCPNVSITYQDFKKELIAPNDPRKNQWIDSYLRELDIRKRNHILLPYHCIDGSWGQSMSTALSNTFINCKINPQIIRYGQYPHSEMTSVFEYDYPINLPELNIPENKELMKVLLRYDKILIAGLTKEGNVAESILSLIANYPKEINNKLVFLKDALITVNPNNPNLNVFSYCEKQLDAIDCLMNEFEG